MLGRRVLLCLLALWIQSTFSFFYTPIVEIEQGKLRGLRSLFKVNRYFGIPYAVANRFQPPRNPPKWNGTVNAINRYVTCAQNFMGMPDGVEQCLQLDLYTPENSRSGDSLPIMVFIHGGPFNSGNKAHYDPEYIVRKNVVAVVINYRLGVFGFLCLNGAANLGLKDQTAALKWIKKNIAPFGGNPDNVTIVGYSSGASIAAMHLLSKLSKGLFHKVILMSGTPITPLTFNVEYLKPMFEDARKLGSVNSEADVLKLFTNATVLELLSCTLDTEFSTRYFKYTPCVDANAAEPFFHDAPYNIIKSGDFNKVPVMMGFTAKEGLYLYGISNDELLNNLNTNFTGYLPSIFFWCSEKDRIEIAQKIRSHYFQDKAIDRLSPESLAEYYSDFLSYSAGYAFSKLIADKSEEPVYNYVFTYEGGRDFYKIALGIELKGSSHVDDLFYVMKPLGIPLPLTSKDRLIIDRYTTLIMNFMKYGDPTPSKSALLPIKWPASSSKALQINTQLSIVKCCNRGQFLRDLICQYGLPGYVPCESAAQCQPL